MHNPPELQTPHPRTPMRTTTIDITEIAAEYREEAAELADQRDELVAEIEEEYDTYADVPGSYESSFEEFEDQRMERVGRARALEEAAENWGGSLFVVAELTLGQFSRIQDEVMQRSFDVDIQREEMNGAPRQGFSMNETLREAIVDSPDGAPDDPAEFPNKVGRELFERVDDFNTYGEVSPGNSSLREAMSSEN